MVLIVNDNSIKSIWGKKEEEEYVLKLVVLKSFNSLMVLKQFDVLFWRRWIA